MFYVIVITFLVTLLKNQYCHPNLLLVHLNVNFRMDKWITNEKMENESSNKFWTNKNITDSQKTCLLKLTHGQYMGNARKQLFFGREAFPSITCPICNSLNPDTWLHVLLKCKQHHIHALRTKRHNKAV